MVVIILQEYTFGMLWLQIAMEIHEPIKGVFT